MDDSYLDCVLSACSEMPYGHGLTVDEWLLRREMPAPRSLSMQEMMGEVARLLNDEAGPSLLPPDDAPTRPVEFLQSKLGDEYKVTEGRQSGSPVLMVVRLLSACPRCQGRGWYREYVEPAREGYSGLPVPKDYVEFRVVECDHQVRRYRSGASR